MTKEFWFIPLAREMLIKALKRNDWKVRKTAKELGMSHMTVYRMIKRFQLEGKKCSSK